VCAERFVWLPTACKDVAARNLRHSFGIFAGYLDGREPLDEFFSAASEGPAPTPQFSRTLSTSRYNFPRHWIS
jgi:hypothetical protein